MAPRMLALLQLLLAAVTIAVTCRMAWPNAEVPQQPPQGSWPCACRQLRRCHGVQSAPRPPAMTSERYWALTRMTEAAAVLGDLALQLRALTAWALVPHALPPLSDPPRCCSRGAGRSAGAGSALQRAAHAGLLQPPALLRERVETIGTASDGQQCKLLHSGCFLCKPQLGAAAHQLFCPAWAVHSRLAAGSATMLMLDGKSEPVTAVVTRHMRPRSTPPPPLHVPQHCGTANFAADDHLAHVRASLASAEALLRQGNDSAAAAAVSEIVQGCSPLAQCREATASAVMTLVADTAILLSAAVLMLSIAVLLAPSVRDQVTNMPMQMAAQLHSFVMMLVFDLSGSVTMCMLR